MVCPGSDALSIASENPGSRAQHFSHSLPINLGLLGKQNSSLFQTERTEYGNSCTDAQGLNEPGESPSAQT